MLVWKYVKGKFSVAFPRLSSVEDVSGRNMLKTKVRRFSRLAHLHSAAHL